MSKSYISKAQLVKLQTLWRQSPWRQEPGPISADSERAARLAWASELVGREVHSFNELTRKEAAKCIDALQGNTHHRDTETQSDQARGTEGRKPKANDQRPRTKAVTMAGAEDLARIQDALSRLGWDKARFEAWLRSPTSPLVRKSGPVRFRSSNPQTRTRGEANRVWWALKRLLKRAGAWQPAGGPEAA